MPIIYKVTNTTNGKVYVGQTTKSLSERRAIHKYNAKNNIHNSYFYNALNKYGWGSFIWDIVAETNNIKLLDSLEIFYIELYDSMNSQKGYNLREGGYNRKLSIKIRQKMSENHSDVSGKNNPMYGKTHTKETREKISQNNGMKGKFGEKNHMYGVKGEKSPHWKGFDDNKMIELYNKKFTIKKIAEIIGCHRCTVTRHLKANGVK